jgi:hypothetical protein
MHIRRRTNAAGGVHKMRHTLPSFLVVTGLLLLTSCSGCDPKKDSAPGPVCGANGTTCLAPGDCCTNFCDGTNHCDTPPTCGTAGAGCTLDGDCCTAQGLTCQGNTCQTFTCKNVNDPCTDASQCCGTTGLTCFQNKCQAEGACVADAQTCSAPGTCCNSEICDLYSQAKTNKCSATACIEDGVTCNANEPCCSGVCDTGTNKCKPNNGFCLGTDKHCTSGSECCSRTCDSQTAKCSNQICGYIGTSCFDPTQCCSGHCTGTALSSGYCEAIPPGSTGFTCKTLGESCAVGTDCCSTNCQGNRCVEASVCNAYGDICTVGTDCCSGLCDTSAGVPGRCNDAPGGCVQSGNPCDNASNCCTRLCEDPGTGVKVCALPGGCRMTGEYCDTTAACCNINNQIPSSQWVQCTTGDNRCDNGGSCNPPGNICGAGGANASQNCCAGKKDVCKADANGIWRCFGGPPGSCNDAGCTGPCPVGWDPNDPACCIPTGTGPESICQFRDQCCGFAPCVPDATGVLHCTEPTTSCLPAGSRCTGSGTACCSPYGCTNLGTELGYRCADPGPNPPGCTPNAGTCSVSGDCCDGFCVNNACALCLPDGNNTCTADAQCCNGICSNGTCTSQCLPSGARCTAGSGTPCCSPYGCANLGTELGYRCADTSGSCGVGGSACSGNTQCCSGLCSNSKCALCLPNENTTCTTDAMCCSGSCVDTNANGTPDTCKPQCVPQGGICTVSGDCCNGNVCAGTNGGLNAGTCEAPTATCANTNESCATLPCCNTAQVCDAATLLCHDPVQACSNVSQGCATTACCPNLGLSCVETTCSQPYTTDCVAEGGTLVNNVSCGSPNATTPCTCEVATCNALGAGCSAASPCCSLDPGTEKPLSCVNSVCTAPTTCSTAYPPPAQGCSLAQPCCDLHGVCLSASMTACNSTSTADCTCYCPTANQACSTTVPCCPGSKTTCLTNGSTTAACSSANPADCYCKQAG